MTSPTSTIVPTGASYECESGIQPIGSTDARLVARIEKKKHFLSVEIEMSAR